MIVLLLSQVICQGKIHSFFFSSPSDLQHPFRYTEHHDESVRRRPSSSTLSEHTPLFPSLQKVSTCTSVMTAADNYPVDVSMKSSFLQSTFNSINILIGVAILTLPVALKVKSCARNGHCWFFFFTEFIDVIERRMGLWWNRFCVLFWFDKLYSKSISQVFRYLFRFPNIRRCGLPDFW
jgi:hypothetical protein